MKKVSARGFTRTTFATQNLRGFTLIELLIVIALLGALAVGLLATIDPFEQLKKGRDTSMRNTVSEFYNANLRYYSTKGDFPWNVSASTSFSSEPVTDLADDVATLQDAGELKARFIDLAGSDNLDKIYVTSTADEHLVVCFKPESKSFQVDPATDYDVVGSSLGGTAGGCGSGTSQCYFCIQ